LDVFSVKLEGFNFNGIRYMFGYFQISNYGWHIKCAWNLICQPLISLYE
jgi:hypothetical protein